ncbi:MAG: hypothetical protein COV76_00965 [Candidatus Omnitrophica bacterium CG11_big_fil_rev_8_21_14_0_20_64_10]|nr:MAG: hypothetical protein COV76_00965 [Candidatus Omnitrophica bacterium CG11_big_fil_rev_8_21_14_0_20_64_10]
MGVRTLLIGCGLIARAKHLPAIRALGKRIALTALCDANLEAARTLARPFGGARTFGDATTALREVRPELVILCTPPQTHRALGVQALETGADLFLEKPMALTSPDCEAILAAARRSGKRICVAFSQTFTPAVRQAEAAVRAGAIGELTGLQIFLSTPADYMTNRKDHWVHRLPGGVFSETGPHILHLALRFLGEIRETAVQTAKRQDHPWSLADDFRITLTCARGLASANLIYTTSHWAARLELLGTEGRLLVDLETGVCLKLTRPDLRPATVWKSGTAEGIGQILGLLRSAGRTLFGKRENSHGLILKGFLDAIEQGTPLPVPPEEGLAVTRAMEQIGRQLRRAG